MVTEPGYTDRQREALERARRHWQRRRDEEQREPPQAPPVHAPTIAIAREAGALGTSIAQEVGRRLGWPVYDHELLELIAKEMGLRVSLVESIDERRQSWILESLQTFGESAYLSENSYVRHLIQTILSLGVHGQCVIVGRGAAQILPPESTLRVRLFGPREDRIANLAARLGLSHDQAVHQLEEIDRERAAFIRTHFHKDPADPRGYDLVLNVSRWGVANSADLVVRAVQHLQTTGVAR